MSAFAPEIELAMAGDFALIEMQTEFHQLANPRRAFRHNRAHGRFVAKPGARFERVANMQLEGIFVARHAGDAALRPGGIRIGPFAFRDHRDRAVLRRLQAQKSVRRCRCRSQQNRIASSELDVIDQSRLPKENGEREQRFFA